MAGLQMELVLRVDLRNFGGCDWLYTLGQRRQRKDVVTPNPEPFRPMMEANEDRQERIVKNFESIRIPRKCSHLYVHHRSFPTFPTITAAVRFHGEIGR